MYCGGRAVEMVRDSEIMLSEVKEKRWFKLRKMKTCKGVVAAFGYVKTLVGWKFCVDSRAQN